MAKMIKFRPKAPSRFGHQRVRSRKQLKLEQLGQLNLFGDEEENAEKDARIIRFPLHYSPFEEALLLDENGDERAREAYQHAIAKKDSIADAYCNLGVLESTDQNIPQAFDCLTNALKYDPRHFEAHYNLANLYSESGNLTLARLHYEIALELRPKEANVYYNLGLVLVLIKDYSSAIEILEKYKVLSEDETDLANADNLISNIRSSFHTGSK